jgi:cytochrome oxidase Cu insertion factor (SCO1/SenC/PrrC family)
MINRKQVYDLASILVLITPLVNMSTAQSSDGNLLPPNSVYNLQVPVEDQFGEITGLDRYKGQPVLITMFYASCPHATRLRNCEKRSSATPSMPLDGRW